MGLPPSTAEPAALIPPRTSPLLGRSQAMFQINGWAMLIARTVVEVCW
jgi:hypothetical protein